MIDSSIVDRVEKNGDVTMHIRKHFGLILIVILVVLAGFIIPTGTATRVVVSHLNIAKRIAAIHTSTPSVRVMTIGSSVAAGWGDTKGRGGYLARAFQSLSKATGKYYQVISWAIPGVTGVQIAKEYPRWLQYVHPQIVVISWGGLDDAVNHTPFSVFRAQVQNEIRLALARKALVYVVTPPVTEAVYLAGMHGLPYEYLQAEMNVAASFHSPFIHIYNVYDQMLAYLKAHHQTYVPYMENSWHPNAQGHKLAGQLLFTDLVNPHPSTG